ncbi:MAG: S-layer homology domain-containing protein, partial [Clostridia bacterium]|nr:S-layer homology domain-containing protein [Clostridia bacterium]
ETAGSLKFGAVATNSRINKNATTAVAKIAFKVDANAPGGVTTLAFSNLKLADKNEVTATESQLSAADGKVTITGEVPPTPVTPTLTTVEIDQAAVTVDGTNGATATLTAKDESGAAVTVAWSVSPTDKGVTVDAATGAVTIDKDAETDTYTFTATPDGTTVLGEAKTVTLTVTNNTPAPTTTNYYVVGNFSAWAVDDGYIMSADSAATTTYGTDIYSINLDLTTESQFKIVAVSNESQTWFPEGMGNNYGENGEITADGSYNIYFAPAGGVLDFFYGYIGLAAEVPTPVTPTLTTVEIDQAAVTVDGTTGATAALTAKDESETAIASGITWSVSPADKGVTVDAATGAVTIAATAESDTYTFTATPDGTSVLGEAKTVTLTVTNNAPVTADTDYGFVISAVNLYDEANHEIGEAITSANAGDIIVVTFAVQNNTSSNYTIGAIEANIGFDADTLSYYAQDTGDTDEEGPFYEEGVAPVLSGVMVSVGESTGSIKFGAVATNSRINKDATTDVAQIAFKVSADAMTGTTVLSFANLKLADKNETVAAADKVSGVDKSIAIVGKAPAVLTSLASDTLEVTVDGTNGATATLTAKDESDAAIDASLLTFTVAPTDKGVTVDATGAVTIAANAEADTYEFTATPASSKVTGDAKTVRVTVSRAAAVITTVTIAGGQTTIAVPTAAASPATTTAFTATVTDQYGDTMDETVAWTIDPAYTGASIQDGVVTITNSAAAGTVTVKATAGSVSDTADLTVTKADAVATSGDLSCDPAADLVVPTGDTAAEAQFSLTVYDQYGAEIASPAITWSISPATDGVTIDQTGKLSAAKAAKDAVDTTGTDVTVTATVDNVPFTKVITVKRAASVVTTVNICSSTAQSPVDAETLFIPAAGAPDNTNLYYTIVYDQYGDEMTPSVTTTWTLENSDSYIYVEADGRVTVKAGADSSKIYTLKADVDSTAYNTVTITLSAIDITWPTETVKADPTYGDDWSAIVTLTGGSAKIGDETVPGTFSIKETGTPAAGSAAYTVNFTSSDSQYNIDADAKFITIAPKTVTVQWSDTELTYNGAAQKPTAAIAAADLVGTDTIALTVSGEQTDANTGYTATAAMETTNANYTLSGTSTTFTISPAEAVVVWSDTDLTYTGEAQKPTASATGVNSETVAVTVSGEQTNAGTDYTATASTTNTNYTLNNATQTFSIAQAEVTVAGFTAVTKEYDGTTAATLDDSAVVITGKVEGDDLTVTATGAFEDKTVGTGKKVTISDITLGGEDLGNYTLAATGNQTETTAEITVKEVTVSGIKANSKKVDGTTDATLDFTAAVITGKADGDDLTVTATGAFEDAEVGTDKKVTISGLTLEGNDKDNYLLAKTGNQEETTANITKKSSGGGSSSGGSTSTSTTGTYHNVTVPATPNGQVEVSKGAQTAGQPVTVKTTPKEGYKVKEVVITTPDGQRIVATPTGNGEYTYNMPNADAKVEVVFEPDDGTIPTQTAFKDVPAGAYYEQPVNWAVARGVTNGTTPTTFSPDAICTRAQMVTFLWRAVGSPEPKGSTTMFQDMDANAFYYKAVLWGAENGIVKGTSETTFSPSMTVTRGMVVTFLYRYSGKTADYKNAFTDVPDNAYYASAVTWALANNITTGKTATTFAPNEGCTRAQIVTFLYRFLGK